MLIRTLIFVIIIIIIIIIITTIIIIIIIIIIIVVVVVVVVIIISTPKINLFGSKETIHRCMDAHPPPPTNESHKRPTNVLHLWFRQELFL